MDYYLTLVQSKDSVLHDYYVKIVFEMPSCENSVQFSVNVEAAMKHLPACSSSGWLR